MRVRKALTKTEKFERKRDAYRKEFEHYARLYEGGDTSPFTLRMIAKLRGALLRYGDPVRELKAPARKVVAAEPPAPPPVPKPGVDLLSEAYARAVADSGLSREEWDALPDEEREARIKTAADQLRKAAEPPAEPKPAAKPKTATRAKTAKKTKENKKKAG